MTGLILKDLLNLKKQGKVYLILIIFYFAIGLVNENSSMFASMMTMVAVLIPITAMAYDETVSYTHLDVYKRQVQA